MRKARMEILLGILGSMAMLLLAPAGASALVTKNGTSGGDIIIIGNAYGLFAWRPVACVDGPNAGDAFFHYLGSSGSNPTIDDDYLIRGLGGSDTIQFIRTETTLSSGECASLAAGGLYRPLNFGTHYVDIWGDAGGDFLYGSTNSSSYIRGGDGNDLIYTYSGGYAYGDNETGGTTGGNDTMCGSAGSADRLYGEGGQDCLEDFSNSFNAMNCGGHPDEDHRDYYDSSNTGHSNCEVAVGYCCLN